MNPKDKLKSARFLVIGIYGGITPDSIEDFPQLSLDQSKLAPEALDKLHDAVSLLYDNKNLTYFKEPEAVKKAYQPYCVVQLADIALFSTHPDAKPQDPRIPDQFYRLYDQVKLLVEEQRQSRTSTGDSRTKNKPTQIHR
jgi:hypothetical protein